MELSDYAAFDFWHNNGVGVTDEARATLWPGAPRANGKLPNDWPDPEVSGRCLVRARNRKVRYFKKKRHEKSDYRNERKYENCGSEGFHDSSTALRCRGLYGRPEGDNRRTEKRCPNAKSQS